MCDEIYKTFDFLKEKIQKRKINFVFFCSFLFFFFLQEKMSSFNSHFSLSLSLLYIQKNIKRQKERVIK